MDGVTAGGPSRECAVYPASGRLGLNPDKKMRGAAAPVRGGKYPVFDQVSEETLMINGTIIGRVGQEPELRISRTGKKVAVFSLAINNRFTDETTWFKVEAWNGLGEQVIMPFVNKGDQIAVTIQNITLETWQHTETGEARGIILVTADEVELLNNRRGDAVDNTPEF